MKQENKVYLHRKMTSTHGTEGILTLPHLGEDFFTLELHWRDNTPSLSCIPNGTYEVAICQSPHFGTIYHVQNVPNRSSILIHWGNFAGDTTQGLKTDVTGCILLGKKRGILDNQKAVLNSRVAIREFMELMQNKNFTLEIDGVL